MPTKDASKAGELSVLDESALARLDDHACCSPVVEDEEATQPEEAGAAEEQGVGATYGAAKKPSMRNTARFSFGARLAGFAAVAILILGTALWLVRPMDTGMQTADYTVEMSMSGFTPPSLDFPAGKVVTLKLVNKESPFHASGAEHQFAVDALGINEKLQAKQSRVITIAAQKPGAYTFYCDVCCGGRKSPTMRGALTFH